MSQIILILIRGFFFLNFITKIIILFWQLFSRCYLYLYNYLILAILGSGFGKNIHYFICFSLQNFLINSKDKTHYYIENICIEYNQVERVKNNLPGNNKNLD